MTAKKMEDQSALEKARKKVEEILKKDDSFNSSGPMTSAPNTTCPQHGTVYSCSCS